MYGSIKGVPKWEQRSGAGVYLGRSPTHVGLAAMILKLRTGHVSCQYLISYIVFDDTFNTVNYLRKKEEPPPQHELVETSTKFYSFANAEDQAKCEDKYEQSLPIG